MLKGHVKNALASPLYADLIMESMGDRVKTLKMSRNLSQEAVGKVIGTTGVTISQWENSITKNFRPENFLRFCAYFNADPYWVVFGAEGDQKTASGRFRRPPTPPR